MIDTTIVLIGPHGAGKTTLGQALAAHLGVPFHDEIGRRFAEDPSRRPPSLTAESSQPDFDRAVFEAELERDASWPAGRGRVVETWHPGNLAYAARRSPEVVRASLERVAASCRRARVLVLPVHAPLSVLAARQSEPGSLAFFMSVARDAERWARRLGLPLIAPVSSHGERPEVLAARVSDRWLAARRSPRREVL